MACGPSTSPYEGLGDPGEREGVGNAYVEWVCVGLHRQANCQDSEIDGLL